MNDDVDLASTIEHDLREFARTHDMRVSGDMRVGQRDAARLCGMALSTFERCRLAGDGPPAFRRGELGRLSFRIGDLAAWLASQRRRRRRWDW